MKFTGNKDADREILSKLEDKELLQACSINRYFKYSVCNDEFFKRRLMKYPNIEKYRGDKNWRRFFLETVYYISKLKEEFKYDYVFGNPEKQYDLLKNSRNGLYVFFDAARSGELALVMYILKKYDFDLEDIETREDINFAIEEAKYNGHHLIVDYLSTFLK